MNNKTKLKKGDKVTVRTGKDKGKSGKIERILVSGKLVVEGINQYKKHRRARKAGEKGQVVTLSMPIDISNVGLHCSKCDKVTRIGAKFDKDKKVRVCVACKSSI